VKIAPVTIVVLIFSICGWAQSPQERRFPESVATVQTALKTAGGGAGTLPILDGFVAANVSGLDQYQRPYYKCSVSVLPDGSGGSRVRVSAKITAWHNGGKPGYEVLPSNGRLESDLLDRLQQALGSAPMRSSTAQQAKAGDSNSASHLEKKNNSSANNEPTISAPVPQFPKHFDSGASSAAAASPADASLQREADGLSEILRNQSHPTNLVAVKKDQTPILQNPALDAKVLFLASAEDEFEIIESNPDWVHVRISGLSRGWLRRSLVEFLDGPESSVTAAASAAPVPSPAATKPQDVSPASEHMFSVSSEEDGSFPGSWEPLKGKTVKIVSVQAAAGRTTSGQEKLKFAEDMFQRKDAASTSIAGLVVIFDTEDGGMIAATRGSMEQYKKGAITEQAFWRQCYVDPPEILSGAN
jgi:hypothetical protein